MVVFLRLCKSFPEGTCKKWPLLVNRLNRSKTTSGFSSEPLLSEVRKIRVNLQPELLSRIGNFQAIDLEALEISQRLFHHDAVLLHHILSRLFSWFFNLRGEFLKWGNPTRTSALLAISLEKRLPWTTREKPMFNFPVHLVNFEMCV